MKTVSELAARLVVWRNRTNVSENDRILSQRMRDFLSSNDQDVDSLTSLSETYSSFTAAIISVDILSGHKDRPRLASSLNTCIENYALSKILLRQHAKAAGGEYFVGNYGWTVFCYLWFVAKNDVEMQEMLAEFIVDCGDKDVLFDDDYGRCMAEKCIVENFIHIISEIHKRVEEFTRYSPLIRMPGKILHSAFSSAEASGILVALDEHMKERMSLSEKFFDVSRYYGGYLVEPVFICFPVEVIALSEHYGVDVDFSKLPHGSDFLESAVYVIKQSEDSAIAASAGLPLQLNDLLKRMLGLTSRPAV